MSTQRLKTHLPTIVALIFTAAMLVGTFVWFQQNTDEMIKGTTESFLEMNAKSQAAAFNTKLSSQVELLHTAAHYWESDEYAFSSDEETMKKINDVQHLETYTNMIVANADGKTFEGNGKISNAQNATWFKTAMNGETYISEIQFDRNTGEHISVAIPLFKNGKIIGAMRGLFSTNVLSSLIEAVGFQEKCTSVLLSRDGSILARSASSELLTSRINNFYDIGTEWGIRGKLTLSSIKLDLLAGKTLTIPYKTGSRSRIAILTPVGVNNWYYAVIISRDVIDRQTKTLSGYLFIVIAAISVAFVLLFITILNLVQHSRTVENANERFKIVTNQTQAIVFDYDFSKKNMELNGNVKFILEDAKESYSGDEILSIIFERLHDDDSMFINELKRLRSSAESSVVREFRLKCADERFYWHRLTGAVVRGADNSALRFVGNIVNVEDEISKEQQLKKRAEIDALSGLLNKGAFTQHVSEILEKSTDENLYAFYIIDLDNFKKVNDTLGHIVGDRVISDVAQKLCTVFSENDLVGRIGGDEFAAFLKLSDSGKALGKKIIEAKASAICKIVDEIYTDGKNKVNITSSIGVSLFPANGKKFNDLYTSADSVLYLSKNGGKNQYHICE